MIKVTLEMHDARKVRPDGSRRVLACKRYDAEYSRFITLPYSAKSNVFNAWDHNSAEEAVKTAIEVDYWCELPVIPGREEEN